MDDDGAVEQTTESIFQPPQAAPVPPPRNIPMQGGYPNPIYPPVYAPSPGYPIQNGMEIHMQPVQGAPPMQSVYQPVMTVGSDGPASMVPEAKSKQEVEDVMQAKPGIFTNQRGNLRVCLV